MEYIIVLERTVIFYFMITILYRFMGKREVGQLGIVDLIVSILIAELAAMSIDNRTDSIFLSIIPIISLVIIQIAISYLSLKSKIIRDIFDGSPSVIIEKGIINFKEMIKQRYNLDDLLIQLREKQIYNIEDVKYAILETSGKLSVFDNNIEYPLPLIIDGKIDRKTLNKIKKTEYWIDKILRKDNIKLEDVFYAFYRNKELYIIKKGK